MAMWDIVAQLNFLITIVVCSFERVESSANKQTLHLLQMSKFIHYIPYPSLPMAAI